MSSLKSPLLRKLICCLFAGLLLFSQFAVAAHACSDTSGEQPSAALADDQRLTDAPAAVTAEAVCDGHCSYGQSSDRAWVPLVAAPALAWRYSLPPLRPSDERSQAIASLIRAPLAAALPHAIVHCCLRT